jgi:hypothetical protein
MFGWMYILIDKGNGNSNKELSHMRDQFWISAISGVAMAAFIHGTSLFIPTKLRMG